MPKKSKCSTCSQKGWCNNHLFSIKPFKTGLYFKKQQKMRLCPKLNLVEKTYEKVFPLLNDDKKFYTPCFILENEKKFYEENDQRVLRKHDIKLQDLNSIQESQIVTYFINSQSSYRFCHYYKDHNGYDCLFCLMSKLQWIPRQPRKTKYCAVCKNDYEDYLQHIESQRHLLNIRKNKYNGYILELQKLHKIQMSEVQLSSKLYQQSTSKQLPKNDKIVEEIECQLQDDIQRN